jgi:sRNA-binding regulator protein Hfq
MNMKLKSLLILSLMVLMSINLMAIKSVTFMNDGRSLNGTLLDMSSRTGMVEYRGNTKIHRNQIWMINYVGKNWNHPNERNQLSNRADTIFLHNGQVMHARIVDFSSRRRMYEFQNGGKVAESSVKRIYFCCNKLPDAYQQALRQQDRNQAPNRGRRGRNNNRYATTFMVNGRSVESPLSYLNRRKTGFMDGLQINTHDVWMINFSDDNWDFARERRQLDRRTDTIFLENGQVVYGNVVDFNKRNLTWRFKNLDPIHESEITRIYFCCQQLPDAYRRGKGRLKNRNNRRY